MQYTKLLTWIGIVTFLLWKHLLKILPRLLFSPQFNTVVPRNEFFSSLRRAFTFNILLRIRTTLPNEAGINLYSQFPLALLSFFPSITVLRNGAGYDTLQCENVRQREREMGIREPENSLGYDSTAKLWKLLGFGNTGTVSRSESSHLCSVNVPDTQPTVRFHVTDR